MNATLRNAIRLRKISDSGRDITRSELYYALILRPALFMSTMDAMDRVDLKDPQQRSFYDSLD